MERETIGTDEFEPATMFAGLLTVALFAGVQMVTEGSVEL